MKEKENHILSLFFIYLKVMLKFAHFMFCLVGIIEHIGRSKKFKDTKCFSFPSCMFGRDDGKVGRKIYITIMPLLEF